MTVSKKTRDAAIDFEETFAAAIIKFQGSFAIGIGGILMMVSWLLIRGQIDYTFGLIIMIYVLQFFFSPYQVLGSVGALARIMEAGLDRYDAVMKEEIIDADGTDIQLENFDVSFDNVTFAYEEENVLKNVSFEVKENSMTALVGKSGCGKTTVTNLIARFWDIQKGQIRVGGVDVKEMTSDSLLRNISMVFQDVYLFEDTIINNVKLESQMQQWKKLLKHAKRRAAMTLYNLLIMALTHLLKKVVHHYQVEKNNVYL